MLIVAGLSRQYSAFNCVNIIYFALKNISIQSLREHLNRRSLCDDIDQKVMNSQCARLLSLQLKRDVVYFTTVVRRRMKTHSLNGIKYKVNPISPNEIFLRYSSCPPKCWQCDFPQKSDLFCSKCKALQKPPKDLNYFDIIGVKQDFDISVEDIQKKYRKLQIHLHPDKFGQKTQVCCNFCFYSEDIFQSSS